MSEEVKNQERGHFTLSLFHSITFSLIHYFTINVTGVELFTAVMPLLVCAVTSTV
jgi:hypothetical protein